MASSTSYVLNIITHTDFNTTDVAFWTLVDINKTDKFFYGFKLDDLFDLIKNNHITKIYCHDDDYIFSYLYNYLLSSGCIMDDDMDEGRVYDCGSYKLFAVNGTTMYIKYKYLYINNGRQERSSTCTFVSSSKIIRSSVIDLNKTLKLNYDNLVNYSIQLNYQNSLSDDDMIKTRDSCFCIAKSLKLFNKTFKLTELTVGSNSVKSWKKLDKDKYQLFAQLDINIERDIYRAYRGGFNWLNPKYRGLTLDEGVVLDINSLFPYVMRCFPCVVGVPTLHNNIPVDYYDDAEGFIHNPYFIVKLRFGGDEDRPGAVLKNNMLPTVSSMSLNKNDNIIKNCYIDKIYNDDLWLTGFDFDLLISHYDINYMNVECCYTFDTSDDVFKNFIDFWYEVKRNSTGALRELSKLMLDNLHGKLGTKVEYIRHNEWIHQKRMVPVLNNGILQFNEADDTKNLTLRYIPASIFINSISRWLIISAGQKYYDRLIYIDADSLHLISLDPVDLPISNDLGDYKVDAIFKKAKYLGLKTYIHDEYTCIDKTDSNFHNHNNEVATVVKMAGAADTVKQHVNWTNFDYDIPIEGRQLSFNIRGGRVRKYSTHTILNPEGV